MKEETLELDKFLTLRKTIPLLDARSEGEFLQSHIPGAINIPILNNTERQSVGTIYKHEGSDNAVLKGFELVGPRFHTIIKKALELFPDKKILIYCWRGGMRSEIMSWLLGLSGFEVYRLKGGYKAYRTKTFITVRQDYNYLVLGGKTGVGKTRLLKKLREREEQIIDLEGLANHKGSSFGGIGMESQPSVEQFENLIAEELFQIPPEEIIWIENESRRIGKVVLPNQLYDILTNSPLIEIERSVDQRIELIHAEYGSLPKEELLLAVSRLKKKLGGLKTHECIQAIENNQPTIWITLLLHYYDKAYEFDLEKNHTSQSVRFDMSDSLLETEIDQLLEFKKNLQWKI